MYCLVHFVRIVGVYSVVFFFFFPRGLLDNHTFFNTLLLLFVLFLKKGAFFSSSFSFNDFGVFVYMFYYLSDAGTIGSGFIFLFCFLVAVAFFFS